MELGTKIVFENFVENTLQVVVCGDIFRWSIKGENGVRDRNREKFNDGFDDLGDANFK